MFARKADHRPACRVGFETASKRPVEAEFAYTVGDFYTGDKQTYSAELDVKPIRYLTFHLGYYLNQVRLPQGDFDTQLASVKMKIAFTPMHARKSVRISVSRRRGQVLA